MFDLAIIEIVQPQNLLETDGWGVGSLPDLGTLGALRRKSRQPQSLLVGG